MNLKELNRKSRRVEQLRKWHLSKRMNAMEGLYYGQIHLLEYIINHPGCNQKDIADMFALSKASVTKSVKRMLNNDIITRQVNSDDERQFELYATEKGIQLARECSRIYDDTSELAYKGFSEEELKQFDEYLSRIMENLETDYSRGKTVRQLQMEEAEHNKKE